MTSDWEKIVKFQADVHWGLCNELTTALQESGAEDVTAAMVSDCLAIIGATIGWREVPPSLLYLTAFCEVDVGKALTDFGMERP